MTPAEDAALNAAQVAFSANPLHLAPQITGFWEAQARVLEAAEDFASGWFRRREEGTRALLGIGRRVVSHGRHDPAAAMADLADLQVRSMARFADDALAGLDMMQRCAGAVTGIGGEAMADAAPVAAPARGAG